jgi:hypothetical protein
LESVRDHRETGVQSCNGAGKSTVASRAALWFNQCFPESIVITTATVHRQVRGILWGEIRKAFNAARFQLRGELFKTQLQVGEKWFALGFTAEDATKFQGWHADHVLCIVDEADGISQEIFDEGVASILANDHARLLMIGNPTNPASEFARRLKQPEVSKFRISAFDTPNFTEFGITICDIKSGEWREKITSPLPRPYLVTPEWVAERFKAWGESSPMFQSRVLGLYPERGDNVLIPFPWIESAVSREPTAADDPIRVLGVDVARYGADSSVIYLRDGDAARLIRKIDKASTTETAGMVAHDLETTGAEYANIDTIGVGAGVYDDLRSRGADVREVNGSSSPLTVCGTIEFLNRRAEIYWGLREHFEAGSIAIDPEDRQLVRELSDIRYGFTTSGKLKIESKEDIIRRTGKSPDHADAVAYAFAAGRPALAFSF